MANLFSLPLFSAIPLCVIPINGDYILGEYAYLCGQIIRNYGKSLYTIVRCADRGEVCGGEGARAW